MNALLIYALLTPALFYLGSRAVITSWLWSRYPPRFARFMDCSACFGTWAGMAMSAILQLPVYPVESWQAYPIVRGILTTLTVGLCSMVWTPILAGMMQSGFERLGTTVGDDDGSQE